MSLREIWDEIVFALAQVWSGFLTLVSDAWNHPIAWGSVLNVLLIIGAALLVRDLAGSWSDWLNEKQEPRDPL